MSGARSAVRAHGPWMSLETHAGVQLGHVFLVLGVSSAQSDLGSSETSFGSPVSGCLGSRLLVCEVSELRRVRIPPGLDDHSTPPKARRLIGGDNVLTVWATTRVQTVSGQCAARQVIGVWSDQRRKVRGYSSGKFCVTRRSRAVHRTNSLDRAFENLMELGPEDVGSGDYASFVATPDGLLPATWAERIPSPEA
jgi:hypothetical protein